MVLLNITIKCDTHECEETLDLQIEWSDVSIDLNDKSVTLPMDQVWHHDWSCGWEYRDCASNTIPRQEQWHRCPTHNKAAKKK